MIPTKNSPNSNSAHFDLNTRIVRSPYAGLFLRFGALLVFAGLVAGSLYWSSTASASNNIEPTKKSAGARDEITAPLAVADLSRPTQSRLTNIASMLALPQDPPPPTVTTYAGDCTTGKSVFNVQDSDTTVCAKVTGAQPGWVIIWSNARFISVQNVPVGSGESTFLLSTGSSLGDWRVIAYEPLGGSVYALTSFTVIDAENPSADMSIEKATGSTVSSGGQVVYSLQITNYGPSDASAEITDSIPAGSTFVSLDQLTGPAFTCINPTPGSSSGDSVCSIASLARGESATFLATYEISAPAGTVVFNTASVTSTTPDPNPDNNSSTVELTISATTAETCELDCPANVVVTANTTSEGQPGAFVTYGAASATGNCGAISDSPASGTFFPVGSHVVTSSSTAGPSCTFTVNVVDTAPPTITCPANKTVTVAEGETEATVTTGAPTTTPSGLTVTGVRSDGAALGDPYPLGSTGITWTATDASGRAVSCTQTITVMVSCGTDTENPTITAPDDVTVSTGPNNTGCLVALNESLGQANANDNCAVTVTVSGIPSGNAFPKGTTVLTYTATDPSGNTASDTQSVTVIDDTPPSIAAPPDASYVCPSEVPAAHPSQATRGQVFDEDGNPLPPGPPFDNCGTPTVTVTEASSGAGSAGSPRIITRTFTATDSSGNSASSVQTITVADGIAPTISAPADANYQCASHVPAANPSQAAASDNCAAPTVTVSETNNGGVGSAASPLIITRTFTATDAAGNSASDAQIITVIDTTPPTISCPADIVVDFDGA